MQFLIWSKKEKQGPMKAVDKFDHTKGFKFSDLCDLVIRQAYQCAIADRTIWIPVHMVETINKLVQNNEIFW